MDAGSSSDEDDVSASPAIADALVVPSRDSIEQLIGLIGLNTTLGELEMATRQLNQVLLSSADITDFSSCRLQYDKILSRVTESGAVRRSLNTSWTMTLSEFLLDVRRTRSLR